jgi:putative phosphoesterase
MKTLLILSDVHGYFERMTKILDHETYDLAISLGDSELSTQQLNHFDIVIHGNHLFDVGETYQVIEIESFKLYLTHGHFEKVHLNDQGLIQKMHQFNCDLVFHGHTHVSRVKAIANGYLINPGAVSYSRSQEKESYIIAQFNKTQCILTFKDLNHDSIKEMTLIKRN